MPDIVMLHYPEIATPNWLLLVEAARRRGVHLLSWAPDRISIFSSGHTSVPLYAGQRTRPEILLHRTVAPFEGIVTPALRLWAEAGTSVLNEPAAAFRTRDKLATTLALCRDKVPVVPTLGFFEAGEAPLRMLGDDRRPLVVKPGHGIKGQHIHGYDTSAHLLDDWLPGRDRREDGLREHYLAQPLVGPGGRDLRAYVVGGRCVALMRRQARRGELRANLALGATGTTESTVHPAAAIAVAAATACELDYGGVDLIEDDDGAVSVLEVDAWAGFAGITDVTGVDVAGAILDLALARHEKGAP